MNFSNKNSVKMMNWQYNVCIAASAFCWILCDCFICLIISTVYNITICKWNVKKILLVLSCISDHRHPATKACWSDNLELFWDIMKKKVRIHKKNQTIIEYFINKFDKLDFYSFTITYCNFILYICDLEWVIIVSYFNAFQKENV